MSKLYITRMTKNSGKGKKQKETCKKEHPLKRRKVTSNDEVRPPQIIGDQRRLSRDLPLLPLQSWASTHVPGRKKGKRQPLSGKTLKKARRSDQK